MKIRKFAVRANRFSLLLLLSALIQPAFAGDATEELTAMLHTFMAGASINDAAAHDRFWADDLIYTSSSGDRFGKSDIMQSMDEPESSENEESSTVYSAEAIQVQQYGDMAVVAFRLVGTESDASSTRTEYLNTGTFLKRNDVWEVVAWQATRIPEKSDD